MEILQFKITLKYSKPPIWRRIQTPANATFLDLHAAIQDYFGWEESHLHIFRFGDRFEEPVNIGPREPEDWGFEDDRLIEKETPLSDWFKQEGRICTYEYDLGDGWEHIVVLEKILLAKPKVKYPICIAGKRACPPEDSGGMGGYEEKLEVLRHPKSKYYREIRDWMGDFDPDHFDLQEIEFLDTYEHDFERWMEERK